MGYTGHTIELVEELLNRNDNIKKVIDLGAQNNYAQPNLPAPYMSEWYENKSIEYLAIDLCKENGSLQIDLKEPQPDPVRFLFLGEKAESKILSCDLLVDAGTSEHVSDGTGKHSLEAIYNCWNTKHKLVKLGGFMVNENPKTGNWPGHGCNYYTKDFYMRLASLCGYEILFLTENAAMGNITDGWNITCVLKKLNDAPFISIEQFDTCGILTS